VKNVKKGAKKILVTKSGAPTLGRMVNGKSKKSKKEAEPCIPSTSLIENMISRC
jgi:hypothetical protein